MSCRPKYRADIELDAKKRIVQNATSYIVNKNTVLIPFNSNKAIKNIEAALNVAKKRAKEVNDRYKSHLFGDVVLVTQKENGALLTIRVPERLLDAYEVKFNQMKIEELHRKADEERREEGNWTINDEGDIVSNEDFNIETNRYAKIIQSLSEKRTLLNSALAVAKQSKDRKKIETLTNKINAITDQIKTLEEKSSLSMILDIAEEDLNNVQDILNSPTISDHDLVVTRKTLDMWTDRVLMSMLFDEGNATSDNPSYKRFEEVLTKANNLYNYNWVNSMYSLIGGRIKERTGMNYSDAEIKNMIQNMNEVSFAKSQTLDLSYVDNILIQIQDTIMKEANVLAEKKTTEIFRKIDEFKSKLEKILPRGKTMFDIFAQLDSKGRKTGRLTHRFAQNFFDVARNYKVRDWKNKVQVKRYKKWKKDNMIAFDYRKLFYDEYKELSPTNISFTKGEIEQHKAELLTHLGQEGYNFYMKQAREKFDKFKDAFQEVIDSADDFTIVQEWENQWSPIRYIKDIYEETQIYTPGRKFEGFEYLLEVPRRYDNTGKDLGYYDSNFAKIEADSNLKEFYDWMMETLDEFKSYYSADITEGLQSNYLPDLPKTMLDNLGSVKSVTKGIFDKFIESITIDEIFTPNVDSQGNVKRSLPVFMMDDKYTKLSKEEKDSLLKKAAEKFKEGSKEYWDYYKVLKDETIQEKLNNKSFDLFAVLKATAMTSLSYKYKSMVEDSIKLTDLILRDALNITTDSLGNAVPSRSGNIAGSKNGLNNLRAMYEYSQDAFYGMRKHVEASNTKILTKEEKQRKKVLSQDLKKIKSDLVEGNITEEEFNEKRQEIITEINSLGKYVKKSAFLDLVNKFITIKGIGWNPFSAFTNLGIGYVVNYTEAADGRNFNTKQLNWAYGKLFNNIFRAGKYVSGEGKKITNLVTNFNLLGEITDTVYSNNTITDKLSQSNGFIKNLLPFEMTKRAEFMNQASMFLAMMKNYEITDLNGKEKTLYDAYDNDGNWKVDEFGPELSEEKWLKFKLKVEDVKKESHGNYDPHSPILAKKHAIGRSIMVFRNWIPSTVEARFGKERYNIKRGQMVKGRYRSYLSTRDQYGDQIGLLNTFGIVGKDIIRQITFNKAFSNNGENLNETDAANLRKNARELMIYMAMMGVLVMLKGLKGIDDEDDEDKTKIYIANYLINTMMRLQNDMEFYVNPIAFEKLTRQTLPFFKVVIDAQKWLIAANRYIKGENGENGSATLEQRTFQLFPGGVVYYNTKNLLEKEY